MSIHTLHHHAWAAVGQHLDAVSLFQLSATCSALHSDIKTNSDLWKGQAERRWPALFSSSGFIGVQDWHAAYKAAHKAAHELATQQPWTASIPSTPSGCSSAQLLVLHDVLPVASHSSDSSRQSSREWQSTTCVAAALAGRLHWWRWAAPSCVGHATCTLLPAHASASHAAPEEDLHSSVAAAAHTGGQAAQHWYSDTTHGHKAPVTVILPVSTGSGSAAPGFATGSKDTTIKLWVPLSGTSSSNRSSSSSRSGSGGGGPVRPSRTLSGHTDRITALACLNPQQGPSDSSSGVVSSAAAPVLVSASADRTIKLWSLSSIQQAPHAANSTRGMEQFADDDCSSSSTGGIPSVQERNTACQRQQQRPQKQQQGRNPLLGTLRGHSSTVTSLLAWSAAQERDGNSGSGSAAADEGGAGGGGSSSGSGSSCGILSCGQDCRVKLWDVSESRRACVATWRLPRPCRQLLGCSALPGCAVVLLPTALQVIDTRVPNTGTAAAQAVITLTGAGSKGLTAAAARCNTVAAGGREGVRAWDVRVSSSSSSSSSTASAPADSCCSSRLLLSGSLPGKVPVSHLHLDSVKLVAASTRSQLHAAAGVAVWALPEGTRVDIPSSSLSGINLHAATHPDRTAGLALNCSPVLGHMVVLQLIETISSGRQRDTAAAIFRGENESDDGDDSSLSSLLSFSEGSVLGDDLEDGELSWAGGDDDGGGDDVLSLQQSLEGFAGLNSSVDASTGVAVGRHGCVEPGVLAMAAQGPLLACVDSLGNLLMRDFVPGLPSKELLQPYITQRAQARGAAAAAANEPQGGSAVVVAEAAEQLSHSLKKFWA